MSKKRIFDIDVPDDFAMPEADQAGQSRRGPMASAISENADAVRERQATAQAIRDENDALAREHVRLKRQGLLVDLLPLDDVKTDKLTRDRRAGRDDELDELKVSIQAIGLSNPIQVEVVGDAFELIQGYRRLCAFRELYKETGDQRYAAIPAALVASGEALERLYRRMVDENLVRRDISFAEMAVLAQRYADDERTEASSLSDAIAHLFPSAGRQKRNYIGHFASLMDKIGTHLDYPEEWELIEKALAEAIERMIESRVEEGKSLSADLDNRVKGIRTELEIIKELAPKRMDTIRKRLDKSLDEIRSKVADLDKNRFEQELIFYMEKQDINEEIVRLTQHLNFFEEMQALNKSNGKKLQFISQEMGREINTIGSKANNADLQRHVVRMKDELEKIKEQVLNAV